MLDPESWNVFDLDEITGIPRFLLWHLHSSHSNWLARVSSNGRGYHIRSDGDCSICNAYSDPNQQAFRELGLITIFDNKGINRAGVWKQGNLEFTEYSK